MAKTVDADKIIEQLIQQLNQLELSSATVSNVGTIIQVGDGVVEIRGLSKAMYGEILDFGHNIYGLVLNLLKNSVGAIIMGDYTQLSPGDTVKSTGRILEIPVSQQTIGRVVNPLGEPVDGKGAITADKYYPVEKIAPGIVSRKPVTVPLITGVKAIDALTPIGRGQRQLIIGDRGTGKSSIAISTIMNQTDQNMICVYVAIGQKKSYIAQLVDIFDKAGALEYTTVVAASASDPVTFQYLAPYVGTAIGEYFMDQGKDVLVVYDDLSKHAWAYREVSLLLRRPAGREAFPGDVFYLHSRLLERACRLNEENGGGSLTALPIIETQAGDVSAYIPTNVISITDGQIYLEPDLFNAGIRPAINSGLSVSRVGSAAQTPKMKQVAGRMKLELAQYRELQAFSQFASDLDAKTKAQLDRGARVTEILKQGWEQPYPIQDEVLVIWAINNNFLDNVPVENIKQWETKYLDYIKHKGKKLYRDIVESDGKFTDKQVEQLIKFTEDFNQTIGKSLLQVKTDAAQQ